MNIGNKVQSIKIHTKKLLFFFVTFGLCIAMLFLYDKQVYQKYEKQKAEEVKRIKEVISRQDQLNDQRKVFSKTLNNAMILAFDLDGDGIETFELGASQAFFDLDGDGFRENTSWVSGDDGVLFLDKNDNGIVDNVNELFGYKNDDGTLVTGIEELSEYDDNKDRVIDTGDKVFAKLMIWQDLNEDGASQPNEINFLSHYNIASINLKVEKDSRNVDDLIKSIASYTVLQKAGKYNVANLNLKIDQFNTIFDKRDYELNPEVVKLPFSRGYGNLKAWHIAMSIDPTLLAMMNDLAKLSGNTDYNNYDQKIEDFIYRWADCENITGFRGVFDAKKLAVIEKVRGKPFIDEKGIDKVSYYNVDAVKKEWEDVFLSTKAKIMIQGTLVDIFPYAKYRFGSDSISFDGVEFEGLLNDIINKYYSLDQSLRAKYIEHILSIAYIFPRSVLGLQDIEQFKREILKRTNASLDNQNSDN